MTSGFFHAFGGCFGIIAAFFCCFVGCTALAVYQRTAELAAEQRAMEEAAEAAKKQEDRQQKEEAINRRIIQGRERQERNERFNFPALPQKTKITPKRDAIPDIVPE